MEILPGSLARRTRPNRSAANLLRQRRLTRAEVDDLVELYATGINVRQLAATFVINRDTALRHLQRRNVPSRASVRKLTDELLATRPPSAGNSPRPESSFADAADPQPAETSSFTMLLTVD